VIGGKIRFAVIALALALAHIALWVRLARGTGIGRRARKGAAVVLATLYVVVVASVATRGDLSLGALHAVGFVWLGVSFLSFWVVVALEVPRAIAASRAHDPARRLVISRVFAGSAAALGLGVATAGAFEARALEVTRVRVPLARLPRELDGLRIAQISDLHVGPSIHADYVARVVEVVNALAPDVIVVTGDLVDGTVEQIAAQVAPIARLAARHGVFFVTGNHEYYAGAPAWIEHIRALGIRVLVNERVSIGDEGASFDLAGVPDFRSGHYGVGHEHDVGACVAGRDPTRELVLLAHQPRSVDEAAKAGVGLQLSGHTHGGQIFPMGLLIYDQPFIKGLHRRGDTWIYVSSGAGYWGPPMRVGAPPEIAEITLVRA
jgi:hypothetical protein